MNLNNYLPSVQVSTVSKFVSDGAFNSLTVANYEYGPFGEVIRQFGPMAKLNPFRFSSKYDDDETTPSFSYGHRYYNPSTGKVALRGPVGGNCGDASEPASVEGFVGRVVFRRDRCNFICFQQERPY